MSIFPVSTFFPVTKKKQNDLKKSFGSSMIDDDRQIEGKTTTTTTTATATTKTEKRHQNGKRKKHFNIVWPKKRKQSETRKEKNQDRKPNPLLGIRPDKIDYSSFLSCLVSINIRVDRSSSRLKIVLFAERSILTILSLLEQIFAIVAFLFRGATTKQNRPG